MNNTKPSSLSTLPQLSHTPEEQSVGHVLTRNNAQMERIFFFFFARQNVTRVYPFRLKPDKGPLEAFLNAISGEHILLAAGTPKTNTEPTPTLLTTVWLSHLVNEKLIRR